ncbi:hypothetical protein BT69DRAFT_1352159 [Atractiella rhizophila]|nr:hypothetical protein BT69DRAFT_1352159 [Atractiella rhizophila]
MSSATTTSSSERVDISTLTRSDLEMIQSFLHGIKDHHDKDDMDETSIKELLKKMEEAEGATDGLEHKLDGLLANLDDILERMEQKESEKEAKRLQLIAPCFRRDDLRFEAF